MIVQVAKDKKMDVTIYTKTNCPFCEKAKAWFKQRGKQYTKIVLDDEEQRLSFYQKISNGKEVRSVPQIFIDDKFCAKIGPKLPFNEYVSFDCMD